MENFNQLLSSLVSYPWFVLPLFIWITFWKAWALWKSSQKRQLLWFIILLLVNTLGLLEIVYIFYLNRWEPDKGKLLAFLEKKFAKK